MKISMYNVDEFTDINDLEEVKSPILIERGGIPHPEGLISDQIFGVSVLDRKETYGYINLYNHFLRPNIYKAIKRAFRNIDKIIDGTAYYSVKDGALVKDEENGETGINFLYENWKKIKWASNGGMSTERAELLNNTPREIAFVDKWLVIPPFYRDIKTAEKGGGEVPELDQHYVNLIRAANLLVSQENFDFIFHAINYKIQETLEEIYDYFKDKLSRKNGLMRRYLLGKNIDYSVRTVISGPIYRSERLEDNIVDFRHSSVPIYLLTALAFPFLLYWLKNFFENKLIEQKYTMLDAVYLRTNNMNSDSNVLLTNGELKNPEAYFNDAYIRKRIEKFQEDRSSRFDLVEVPLNDGSMAHIVFTGYYLNENGEKSSTITRAMTWCDLFYIGLAEMTKDKYVMITRYPVLDAFGIVFTKVRIGSTLQTVPIQINDTVYKWYPNVDLSMPKHKVANYFDDTLKFSNSYLKGLDGDYDGDQTTCKLLWSIEANAEAEKIVNSKQYFLTPAGNNIRGCEIETIQTLYALTKDPPEWSSEES